MKKVFAVVFAVVLVVFLFSLNCFAVVSGAYIDTVGADGGIAPVGTWGVQYEQYGGFSILPGFASYFRSAWGYEPSGDLYSVRYSIIMNLPADTLVTVWIPYHYWTDDDEFVGYPDCTIDTASRVIIGEAVVDVKTSLANMGAGEYVAFYNDTNHYTYTLDTSQTAIRIQFKASDECQYVLYLDVRFHAPDLNEGNIAEAIDNLLHDDGARGVIPYFKRLVDVQWVTQFVVVTFMGVFLGILINAARSL